MRKKIIWIVVIIMLIAVYPIIKKPHTISEFETYTS